MGIMSKMAQVKDPQELKQAIEDAAEVIEIIGEISGSPMITLPEGTTLRGGTLVFGARGVRLTKNNTLDGVTIKVPVTETAILLDTSVADFGTLTLKDVTTRGQIAIIAEDNVRAGHVRAENVRVEAADVRGRYHRPHGFGVDALQGAFTLWNRQPDEAVRLSAELVNLSAGSEKEPVRGSGIFVGGHGDSEGQPDGGTVSVQRLSTGEIHTDGGISEGAADLISGGVFVISGANVDEVENLGQVTTYGQNDMVLDNWGAVKQWTAREAVTSHGASGIGFVNFGDIDSLVVDAPITTTGDGARGFNLYDGSLNSAVFHSIATTGDGSLGIQVSKPLPHLEVHGDVTTSGGEGTSLVRGEQVTLKAIALSVKESGAVETLRIGGALVTTGDNVATLEVAGKINALSVDGGVRAEGMGSDGVHLHGEGVDLSGLDITAASGEVIAQVEQP